MDIKGVDPTTGAETAVPQEAAAAAYKAGKLRFTGPVPVTLNGVAGTLPPDEADAALANGDAELNVDPHGAAKAFAAASLRSATLGASDWAAIEGQRLLGDHQGAETTKQELEGLKEAHPIASAAGDLTGAAATLLIPGEEGPGAERLAAAVEPGAASAASSLLSGQEVAAGTGSAIGDAGQALKALADGNAAMGATKGSALARTLRALDPYTYVGRAGSTAGEAVARVLGEGKASRIAAPLTKLALEGSLIGAANAADEYELGDPNFTGEAYLTQAAEGGLWGIGLGLVGAGGKRILTGAGRMADRLATGSIHGTPGQMDRFTNRFKVNPGEFMLENGWSPLMSAEQQYAWANQVREEAGSAVGRVVKDAGGIGNASAQELYEAGLRAMDEPLQQYGFAGGNAQAMRDRLEQELRESLGVMPMPEPPKPVTEAHIDLATAAAVRKQGLRIPKRPVEAAILKDVEKAVRKQPASAMEIHDFIQRKIAEARNNKIDITDLLSSPSKIHEGLVQERVAAEFGAARDKSLTEWGDAVKRYDNTKAAIRQQFVDKARETENVFNNAVAAAKRHNELARVSFEQARDVRIRLDKVIPWNYINAADRVTNAAAEIKFKAREAIEDGIERSIDLAARKAGDGETLGKYMHAKTRYSMATEIEKMARKGRAREAVWFGRPSRVGGLAGHVGLGLAAAITGHPLAGAAAMVGGGAARHYGPRVAAWALHKASRIARLKSLRQEVAIATRRGVRATLGESIHVPTARTGVPDLAPHEMRVTAAKAMSDVAKLAANPQELRSRLAAFDPGMNVLAPKTFDATEGAFRRAVTYLAMEVPPRLMAQHAADGHINPRDLSDGEARDFMEFAAVAKDPRVATDAMAAGNLSATQAKAFKSIWPAIHANTNTIYQRQRAMNRGAFDFLHPNRKRSLDMMFGGSDPSLTLALQANAAAMAGTNQQPSAGKGAKPSGMQHAAATSQGMAATVGLMNTQAQQAESGAPGRRGKRGAAGSESSM